MAGTYAFNPALSGPGVVNKITCDFTSDGSGNASVTTEVIRGVILRVVTNPGSAAPSDNWDLTVADEDGVTILTDSSRDTANSEQLTVVDAVNSLPIAVCGALTLTIANAGASKTGQVIIYFR